MPEIRMTIEVPGAPYDVTVDEAGALWFTMAEQGSVARWTGDSIEAHTLVPATGQPTVIVAAPDDAVWFTEFRGNRIGRISADGDLSFVAGAAPYGLCLGPDDSLWWTELQSGHLGSLSADGIVTRYPVEGTPSAITTGPDGALWFVEIGAGQVGRITVDGAIEEFPLPDRTARPHAIITGTDGALWFTQWANSRLGRITTTGQITELELPGTEPHGLTVDLDGAIWVAMESGTLVCVEPI